MRGVAAIAALLGAACSSLAPPEPMPLRGPSPERIAIWPAVVGEPEPLRGTLLVGLDGAVRARGHQGPSLAVGRELLAETELGLDASGAPADLAAVGKALRVDAVLVLSARRFDAEVEPWNGAAWSLSWRLWSTRGHGLLWQFDHDGAWQRQRRDDGDPVPRTDDDLHTVAIGGGPAQNFRDLPDLVRSLHRLACDHLPAAVR